MKTKFCQHCGTPLLIESQFCPSCGIAQSNEHAQENNAAMTKNNGQLSGPINSYKRAVTYAFSINRCFSRADYWWTYLDNLVLSSIFFSIVFSTYSSFVLWISSIFLFSIPTVIQFTATIRRLHDTGRSGHFFGLFSFQSSDQSYF